MFHQSTLMKSLALVCAGMGVLTLFWLVVVLLIVLFTSLAQAQTPHSNVTHAADNASAYITSNEADDWIDSATQNACSIAQGDANYSLSTTGQWWTNGPTVAAQYGCTFFEFTSTLTADRNITLIASKEKRLTVRHAGSGGDLIITYSGSTDTVTVTPGLAVTAVCDGTDCYQAQDTNISPLTTLGSVDGTADKFILLDATDGALKAVLGEDLPGSGAAGGSSFRGPLLHVRDEKTVGTDGGSSSATTWHTRTLNTVTTNDITGASLASNQITLPAGTYFIFATAPAVQANNHKLRLRNITDSSNEIVGTTAWNEGGALEAQTRALISGQFTISAEKDFELQHFINNAQASTGLGLNAGGSEVEVFAEVTIWQIPDNSATVQTTDATTGVVLFEQDITAGESILITAKVIGRNDSNGDTYTAWIKQVCANEAGTTTCATQDRTEVELSSPPPAANAAIVADNTNDQWEIQVDGFAAATTVNWAASFETVLQQ